MIPRRTPLKRSTVRIPARRGKPRRGPQGIPADEWRNDAYKAFLRENGKCVACERMIRDPHLAPDVRMDKLRPGMMGGFCDPAHTQNNGMRSKGPDASCAPLCRGLNTPEHHREYDAGRAAFESKYGLNIAREAEAWWMVFQVWKERID